MAIIEGDYKMKLSNEEIFMLSNGLLTLIHNCSEAIKLVPDKKTQKGIHNTIRKYQELNTKLMEKIDIRLGIISKDKE